MVLNDLPNIGPVTLNRLLLEFGNDPVEILSAPRRRLETVKGVGPETSEALTNWRTHFDLAREEERLAKTGTAFITTRDPGYPKLLKEIHDPPIGLYRKGDYNFFDAGHHGTPEERAEAFAVGYWLHVNQGVTDASIAYTRGVEALQWQAAQARRRR